jgi:acetyl esterase/lipase
VHCRPTRRTKMAAYGFEEPPTAYTRDAKESGAGEYAMAAQLVADGKPDYRVLDVDAALGVRLHVFDQQQQQQQGPAVAAERACALLFHGGGWSGGDPSLFHPAARYLAGRGLVAICVQYRLMAGEVTAFDCVADCRAALAFVRANAAQLGVDPHRISAMGDSAGGHLALMLGYPAPTGGGTPADAIISYNPVADLETCASLSSSLRITQQCHRHQCHS